MRPASGRPHERAAWCLAAPGGEGCEPIPQAEALMAASGADIRIGGDQKGTFGSADYAREERFQALDYVETAERHGCTVDDVEQTIARVPVAFDRVWARDGHLLRRPQEDMCQALGVPPLRKYEDHGGPGVADILRLLAASDRFDVDRHMVMKAVIAFWLIGATDGQAKNFSIHLAPGGRFSATPLYDVLSAEPSLAAHQVGRRQMRLAMAIGDR